MSENGPALQRSLSSFDVTNITVGAIVGADIYVASAITASMLGPASLIAWVVAGGLATIIALTLAECARLCPEVGGPYAYTARAFGPFPGFLAGWSMWIAELTALPVFAIAFTNYLGAFVTLSNAEVHLVRLAFLALLTAINVASVRLAGRVNDALTLLKLAPLVALVLGAAIYAVVHGGEVGARLDPFAPFGFERFPEALTLIVWAYMGFELSTVPAGEVANPGKTIPRAMVLGMAIVTAFYLTTNLAVYALVGTDELAASQTPLRDAATVVFGGVGAALMTAGAMVSVSGSNESDMLGASRLSFAMAADGLLPHRLASIHPRFRTPWLALIVQAAIAMALTFVDALPGLISFAVVNLMVSFLLSAFALLRLRRGHPRPRALHRALPYLAIVVCVGLLSALSLQNLAQGVAVLAIGTVVFLASSPRQPLPEVLDTITDRERVLARLARRRMRFLGGAVGMLAGHRTPPRRRAHDRRGA